MLELVIIDTSILLELLKVPGKSTPQHFDEITKRLKTYIKGKKTSFVLPVTAIWETGNHIAKLTNGNNRRLYAEKFVEQVKKSLNGESPFTARPFPRKEDLLNWLTTFPDSAQKSKSADKPQEGLSWGDHSIIGEWQKIKEENPTYKVSIWSMDIDLMAYGESE